MCRLFACTAVLALLTAPVVAQELAPLQNYSVHLGGVTGSVYVQPANGEMRLIATLSSGADETPVRFMTTLASGQAATVSVPRGVGETSLEVTFRRVGDGVTVQEGNARVGSLQ